MNLKDFRNIPFRMRDLSSAFPDCVNLKTKTVRLVRDGDIIRLKKGLFVLSPSTSNIELSPYILANHIYGPSYVSMQTALRYYGLIPEAVYSVQSMTTGKTQNYVNSEGYFGYTHVSPEYYRVGVAIKKEAGATFMIATPEKALCDLMVFTPNLNLRFQSSIREYLEDDIRFDMSELRNIDLGIIEECALVSRKKTMLNQLIKFISHERSL